MLQQLGVRFELLLPRPDEDAEALEAELARRSAPTTTCCACARRRRMRRVRGASRAVMRARPILVADTTVTLDGAIMGKPADADDAVAMLERARPGAITKC